MSGKHHASVRGELSGRAIQVLDQLIAGEPSTYADLALRLRCTTLEIHNGLWELHCAERIDFHLGRRGQMTNITLRHHHPTPNYQLQHDTKEQNL